MNIVEALKSEHNDFRITGELRYLYWNDLKYKWTVCNRFNDQKIIETDNEESAVAELLKG